MSLVRDARHAVARSEKLAQTSFVCLTFGKPPLPFRVDRGVVAAPLENRSRRAVPPGRRPAR